MSKLITLLFLFICWDAAAAVYYVEDKSGSTNNKADGGATAWSNAQSESTPCSAGTAMARAAAGDTVRFLDGQYELIDDNGNYEIPALSPSNSGTSGSPIVFMSDTDNGANLHGIGDSAQAFTSNLIGSYLQDYIVWDGFELTAVNSAETDTIWATVRAQGASGDWINGFTLKNCKLSGKAHSYGYLGYNNAGIFMEYTTSTTVENNEFYGFRESSNSQNNAAIESYHSDYISVKNNYINNATIGVYLKVNADNCVVENNFIYDTHWGIWSLSTNLNDSDSNTFRNNIIAEYGADGISTKPDDENYRSNDTSIYNNTIYDSGSGTGIWVGISDASNHSNIYNNIVVSARSMTTGSQDKHIETCDHNQWSASVSILAHEYETNQATYTSLSSWQSSGELYDDSNPGSGSLSSDPQFVAASGNRDTVEEFALAVGSPCLGAGRSSADIGADYLTVGIDAQGESPGAGELTAPTNLTATKVE